jgi:hypothetical protein
VTNVGDPNGPFTGKTDAQIFVTNGQPWIYPGGAGHYSMNIYREEIEQEVQDMVTYHGLPAGPEPAPDLRDLARQVDLERNVAHEFGHSLGLFHHLPCWTEGSLNCIMTYWWMDFEPDIALPPSGQCQHPYSYNPPPSTPEDWQPWFNNYGTGYGFLDDNWNCASHFRFCPYGQ